MSPDKCPGQTRTPVPDNRTGQHPPFRGVLSVSAGAGKNRRALSALSIPEKLTHGRATFPSPRWTSSPVRRDNSMQGRRL
jgi:hypothetical protein